MGPNGEAPTPMTTALVVAVLVSFLISAILWFIAAIELAILAARRHVLWLFAVLLVPMGGAVFIATHWDHAKPATKRFALSLLLCLSAFCGAQILELLL